MFIKNNKNGQEFRIKELIITNTLLEIFILSDADVCGVSHAIINGTPNADTSKVCMDVDTLRGNIFSTLDVNADSEVFLPPFGYDFVKTPKSVSDSYFLFEGETIHIKHDVLVADYNSYGFSFIEDNPQDSNCTFVVSKKQVKFGPKSIRTTEEITPSSLRKIILELKNNVQSF